MLVDFSLFPLDSKLQKFINLFAGQETVGIIKSMKKYFFYVISIAVVSCVFFSGAFAQEQSAMDRISQIKTLGAADWQSTVDDAKKEVQDLLRENERLSAEYDFLKEELSTLQAGLLELKEEVESKERSNEALNKFHQDQKSSRAGIKKDMARMKQEIAEIEKEKNALLNQLNQEEKQTGLWQSKLSDLQVKERELGLELKLQEIARQELEQGQDEELERLKDELSGYQGQEKKLEKELRTVEDRFKKIPYETDEIAVFNKEMEMKIERVRSDYEAKKRANQELSKKNEALEREAGKVPENLVKEKKEIEKEIRDIEQKLNNVRQSIADSADLVQKKRQLMDEIMRMDSENQELRKKIDALMNTQEEPL